MCETPGFSYMLHNRSEKEIDKANQSLEPKPVVLEMLYGSPRNILKMQARNIHALVGNHTTPSPPLINGDKW